MSWKMAVWTAARCWLAAIFALVVVCGFVMACIFFPVVMVVVCLVSGFAITVWAVRL